MKLFCKNPFIFEMLILLCITSSCRKTEEGPEVVWEKTFGGLNIDEGHSVQQTSDGGYIVAGYTKSFGAGGNDVYLIKTDANGDTLWARTYGGASDDYGKWVQQTFDGGYIIAGWTWSFGECGDVYLVKTDAHGDILWTKTYGGTNVDEGYSVQQTSDGGYIIVGQTHSFGASSGDIFLIKTDVNGEILWIKAYGGTNSDDGRSVQQTSGGGYIVVGFTGPLSQNKNDVYLIRTDLNGDTIWTKTYGGTGDDVGYSVLQTSEGGYIVTGHTSSLGAGGADVWLLRIDADGDTLWTKTYGGSSNDYGESVQQTSDGGYVIVGWSYSFSMSDYAKVYLVKTDENGDVIWTRTYGGVNYVYGRSVQQAMDGGYIVTGNILVLEDSEADVYLLKTGSNME